MTDRRTEFQPVITKILKFIEEETDVQKLNILSLTLENICKASCSFEAMPRTL